MHIPLPTYVIDEHTYALIPAKSIDYETIIKDGNGIKYVKDTPFNLVRKSCRDYWGSYEGNREAVIHHLNFIQKVPIPICIRKGIYLFPTHSPSHLDNHWIAFKHVASIHKGPQQSSKSPASSIITFTNGRTITLHVSLYSLNIQMQRTFKCMYKIEGMTGIDHIYPLIEKNEKS